MTKIPAVPYQSWVMRILFTLRNLAGAFQHNTTFLAFIFERPSKNNNND